MSVTNDLDAYFRDLEAQDKFSGVSLITQGETILYANSHGYANRAWQVKNNLMIRFDTASVTKLFTAVATLQLIEQKRLAFDTCVIDFLGLTDTNIACEVNVFHLLTHTSGIGDDADEEAGESYEELWKTKPNYAVTETIDFLPQFVHKPPNFAPGQNCRYCNCGYVLLGLLIEQSSGMNYHDYVRQHIFAQAGMTQSDFLHKAQVHKNIAEGSDPLQDATGQVLGWRTNIYSFPPIGSPDGGAYVTAADLDRFLRAVQAGQLLSPALTTAFLTPQVPYRTRDDRSTIQYGYGLWFHVDQTGQILYYQKEGINAGVSAVLRHYPAQDINVVLLSNMSDGVWQPVRKIHEWLMPAP